MKPCPDEPSASRPGGWAGWRALPGRHLLAAGAAIWVVVVSLQWLGGAYQSEFGAHPDEAAHYVTGLMVRDYLAHGLPGSPMGFARDYYDHYPKVALGNWPPFFYVIQSAWTIPFTPGRISILLMMSLLATGTGVLLVGALKREVGTGPALFGALLLVALPLVQQYSGMIMTEIPLALLALAAALCFGSYLDNRGWKAAFGFGIFATLAILTKGSGLFLAFVPPLAILFTRRWNLLKRFSFWTPAAMVAVLCAPWTVMTLKLAQGGWAEGRPSWHFTRQALPYYAEKLYLALGILLVLLALMGLWSRFIEPARQNKLSGKWAAAAALLASVLLVQPLIPCGLEARHLIIALPPLMMFAVAGAVWASGVLTAKGLPARTARLVIFGVTAAGFLGGTFEVASKGYGGFGRMAAELVTLPAEPAVALISSDASGEGMLIAEIAMRERRPGHRIQRASKVLASSTWSGQGYQTKFETPGDVLAFLKEHPVQTIVLDGAIPKNKHVRHHDLLRETVEANPAHFQLLSQHPAIRAGNEFPAALELYRFVP
jgi:hypothetical protein